MYCVPHLEPTDYVPHTHTVQNSILVRMCLLPIAIPTLRIPIQYMYALDTLNTEYLVVHHDAWSHRIKKKKTKKKKNWRITPYSLLERSFPPSQSNE